MFAVRYISQKPNEQILRKIHDSCFWAQKETMVPILYTIWIFLDNPEQ